MPVKERKICGVTSNTVMVGIVDGMIGIVMVGRVDAMGRHQLLRGK